MKTKKILAIFCCALLLLSMAGCFPFNMLNDAMQNNNGGADGPTSVIVASDPSEEPSEEPSAEPSEFEFDFEGFEDLEITEEPSVPTESSEIPSNLYDATAVWYGYEDKETMWLFFDTYVVLYDDAYNFYIASYAIYYDEDAIQYIANDLSEYGFTEEEQRESIGDLDDDAKYFLIVFSDIEIYENSSFVGYYEDDVLPFVGFEYTQDGVAMYDLINMSNKEFVTLYTFDGATNGSANAETDDTQRIGSELCGYTDVPANFVKYSDIYTDDTMVQYSDPTGNNIVTMSYYSKSTYDAKSIADYMMDMLYADSEIDEESITGAMVDLDGSQAYQIYGYYPDYDMYLVIYILDSPEDDENIHYLAIEFTSDNIALVQMVEYNYHVKY